MRLTTSKDNVERENFSDHIFNLLPTPDTTTLDERSPHQEHKEIVEQDNSVVFVVVLLELSILE